MRVKVVVSLLFLPALLWLSYLAVASGLAQFLSYPAQQLLISPGKTPLESSDRAAYKKALSYLEVGLSWNPDNSQLLEMSGEMLLRLGETESGGDIQLLHQAATDFRRAITAEPGRAFLWARLASIKASLYEFDAEFSLAYQNAFTLGQSDYSVNRVLVEVGLTGWDNLPGNIRLIHKKLVRRFYQTAPMETIELAQRYNNLHMVCIWVSDMPLIDGTCGPELENHQ